VLRSSTVAEEAFGGRPQLWPHVPLLALGAVAGAATWNCVMTTRGKISWRSLVHCGSPRELLPRAQKCAVQ